MEEDIIKNYYFECCCHSDEHLLKFTLMKMSDELFPYLYTHIFLDEYPFYKRIWKGIKYIFGYKSKYGHWNSWEMKREDVEKFKQMIQDYENLLKEIK